MLPPYIQLGEHYYDLRNNNLPSGYSLYQLGDDFQILGEARECASGGCPAIVVLQDKPDTVFSKNWQLFLYAINIGMQIGSIISLMGDAKALMNTTEGNGANYITNGNLDKPDPNLDKLRGFALDTYAGKSDGVNLRLLTMDGSQSPPMKTNPFTGKPYPYPGNIGEVDTSHYLYHPSTHRYMFLDCKNVQWKLNPKRLAYGPFDKGVIRSYIPDNEIHTFFPLVSRFGIIIPLKFANKVSTFPSPFRR